MSKDALHITQKEGAPKNAPSTQRSKRDLVSSIIAALVILVGIALLMYPHVSNWLSELSRKQIMNEQLLTVEEVKKEDLTKYLEQARAYNERLFKGQPGTTDPFGAGRIDGTEEYRSLLNLAGDGVMATIHIPKVNINDPIYHGISDEVLEHGVGHMPTSSLPVGGENTHCILTGHTGLPSAKFFDNIDRLQIGDWFIIEVLDQTLAYEVYATEVVLPEEVSTLTIQEGKDLVTLVTCTPYGVNTHRLLVHGKRCEVPQEWKDIKASEPHPPSAFVAPVPLWPWVLSGIGIAVALLLVVLAARRVMKSRKKDENPSGDPSPDDGKENGR